MYIVDVDTRNFINKINIIIQAHVIYYTYTCVYMYVQPVLVCTLPL